LKKLDVDDSLKVHCVSPLLNISSVCDRGFT
jgi:hypothetical protein